MVSIEDAVTARYETGGNRFEILIDSELAQDYKEGEEICLLYTSPSPRDRSLSRMPSSA